MFGNLRLLGLAAVAAGVLVGWSGIGTAGAQSACADLGGTVAPDQICHVHTAGSSYTLDISFPVDYPDQRALTDYLTQERDQLVSYAAQNPPRRSLPYELDITGTTYRSGTPVAGTQSLVFEVYYDTGGAHPVTGYEAFNYDLSKGAPITFDSLFKPGTKPLEVLDPTVQRKLEKRWEGEGGRAPVNDLGVKVYQNFAITDDAVIFFIGQGQWLAEVAGPQKVSVPELASLLA
jgi:Protein of unknown function (DUF3298)